MNKFHGGPLHNIEQVVPIMNRLYLHECDDESLHLYAFDTKSMTDGSWKYLGEVCAQQDAAAIDAAVETFQANEDERVRQIVREEIAKALANPRLKTPEQIAAYVAGDAVPNIPTAVQTAMLKRGPHA